MQSIALRPVRQTDADAVFTMMADAESRLQAAFVHPDPHDRVAIDQWWHRVTGNPSVRNRAIVCADDDERVIGTIAAFDSEGDRDVTYWIDRPMMGRGIALAALALLLAEEPVRPLHARAAADNRASCRVLERSGFVHVGTERSFAAARDAEIEEFVFRLDERHPSARWEDSVRLV